MKRALLLLALALQLVTVANLATAEVPWPECFPCPTSR